MTAPTRAALTCSRDTHVWDDEADAEGDTCNCGAWYRFKDRIERTVKVERVDSGGIYDGVL